MAAISECIVREYFEMLGYFVNQPRKSFVPGRPKKPEEEVDLLIEHPRLETHAPSPDDIWTTAHLKTVVRAVVGIRGRHTERFYATTLEQTPEVLRFVSKESLDFAARLLGSTTFAAILCVPRVPSSPEGRRRLARAARERGITGILPFETILRELVNRVNPSTYYEKSDLLQTLRLLKNYDLIRGPQLELFERRRRRSRPPTPE